MKMLFSLICLVFFSSSSNFANNTPIEIDPPTIIDLIIANEDCTTLKAALDAAGLIELLTEDGPYTVFAPVNAAFDQLPDGLVTALLQPASHTTLSIFMKYHIVSGAYSATDLIAGVNANNGIFSITTLQGGKLDVSTVNGDIILTDMGGKTSTILIVDFEASNGYVHAIDSVVKPEK